MTKPAGWRKEPARHALAAKGVRTSAPKRSDITFRTVKVQIPADDDDFRALGQLAAHEEETIDWIREWFIQTGHEPTAADYLEYAESMTEHILSDSDGSQLEEYLSYLEGSPKYQSARHAWAEGYAKGVEMMIMHDRKANPNFPRPSDKETREDARIAAATHGAWARIMRNAEKQAQLLIRGGKPPIVSITGEQMTYDPKQRAFIGSKYGTVFKIE